MIRSHSSFTAALMFTTAAVVVPSTFGGEVVPPEGSIVDTFGSDGPFTASPVLGTIGEQIATLNSGVPTAAFSSRVLVGSDYCGGCQPIEGVPEVSLNNIDSAFYLFPFDIPFGAENISLVLKFTTDDQGIAFVNGTRISALMTGPNNVGTDSTDGEGLPILTWPTIDTVTVNDPALFSCGENQLLVGLCGNCSVDPTGFAFTATLIYSFEKGDLPADIDGDGDVNGADLGLLLAAWGECPSRGSCDADLNCDQEVDGGDLGLLLAQWTG
jgi:hypothetical protein